MMILIKLGGSVITDKSNYKVFNKDRVARLCKEIKASGKDAVIVHGAGSFGHVVAKEFKLQNGYSNDSQIPAVTKVSHDMRVLNNMVMDSMIEAGINAVSIPPGACFEMEDGELVGDASVLIGYLELGIMPVMFGDVILDVDKRFGIVSGDKVMETLASLFSPESVVFVSDIDGLYDKDPKANKNAKLIETVDNDVLSKVATDITVDDVTGGVRAKMESMLRMTTPDRECILINGTVDGRLYELLSGKDVVCTRAKGGI